MSGTFPISRARRRGQALLLAVLIMVFAALTSAAFIGVVSTNLNQTARQTDKDRAASAAQAGLKYVNEQLTYSAEGDKWRATPLPSTDPNYNFYYSPLDVAQGWAGQFARYPDPRGTQVDGPQFLAKVERVPFGSDRAGSLKITVIGLSAEDPTAWNRIVVYKGGYDAAPIEQAMRTVSNYDFKNKVVPSGEVTNYDSTTTPANPVITISKTNTDFVALSQPYTSAPAMPFAITFSNPNTNRPAKGAVVKSVALVTPATVPPSYKLTLTEIPTTAPVAVDHVELAATIGAPNGIRDDNLTLSPVNFDFSAGSSTGGTRVNGGLWWQGAVNAVQLRSVTAATSTLPPAKIQTSGTIAINGVTLNPTPAATPAVVSVEKDGVATPTTLTGSDDTAAYDPDIVIDGWNRLKGGVEGISASTLTRSVNDFLPPDITSSQNLQRYRNMTRFSKPGGAYTSATASLYGYGQGIYIDNYQDKEKIFDTTLREMTQAELLNMWVSSPATTPPDFTRSGSPLLASNASASLEQQHLRGWVGPDEFRPRGVSIEINGAVSPPTLIVTRDGRDDTPLANLGQDPGGVKAWKDSSSGAPLDGGGVYSEELPWPTNGVVFAEGNVRIKGNATNSPCSLTVVSMNNIYIEDSLGSAPNKILLLAKRNVVLNPTRVLGAPDDQTMTTAPTAPYAAGAPVSLIVSDGSLFLKGDYIHVLSSAGLPLAQGYITTAPTATTLQFTPIASGTIAANSIVLNSSVVPKSVASTSLAQAISYSPIGTKNDFIQRRIEVNAVNANLRVALNHGADNDEMFSISATSTGTTPATNVYASQKMIPNPGAPPPALAAESNVTTANKVLLAEGVPTTPTDTFPFTPSATETLQTVSTFLGSNPHNDTTNNIGWTYAATDFGTTTPDFANLPFFYLAGFGNRHDYNLTTGTDWRKDILAPASPYKIPLATSIGVFLNGAQSTLTNERWNISGTPAYDTTTQIGFNPDYTAPEDVLTSDQGFYQKDPAYSTLDSRSLGTLPVGANSLVFQQSAAINSPANTSQFPDYRLRGIKLEDVELSAGIVQYIKSTHTFDVNAFVYAQTGSWFIIPGPMFDERLRGDSTKNFIDLNNNGLAYTAGVADPGEFLKGAGNTGTVLEAGDYADLNRNGTIEDFEKYAVARYARYNYSINFNGAIAENQTALVNDSGTATGAVADWMNKWVKVEILNPTSATPTTTYDRIKYTFDPSVALGILDNDAGFHLPQTPQLTYEG